MKLYFAGAENSLKDLKENGGCRLLITMASGERNFSKARTQMPHCDLLIDSGAFTFQTKGDMTLSAWIEMAHRVKPFGNELIALDVIGDPKKTWENFQEIIKEIPDAIPTFHITADKKYLDLYLKHTNRIAIGQMVPFSKKQRFLAGKLAEIFSAVDKENIPKFHAFGVCNRLLTQFPFYSADASSWRYAHRQGFVAKFNGSGLSYTESLRRRGVKNIGIDNFKVTGACSSFVFALSIKAVLDFEKYLTALWAKRGIIWDGGIA